MKTFTPPGMDRTASSMETGTSAATGGPFAGLKSTDRAVREEILHRAYAIWESEGRPPDRKLANWLEAEAEIMGCTQGVNGETA